MMEKKKELVSLFDLIVALSKITTISLCNIFVLTKRLRAHGFCLFTLLAAKIGP